MLKYYMENNGTQATKNNIDREIENRYNWVVENNIERKRVRYQEIATIIRKVKYERKINNNYSNNFNNTTAYGNYAIY